MANRFTRGWTEKRHKGRRMGTLYADLTHVDGEVTLSSELDEITLTAKADLLSDWIGLLSRELEHIEIKPRIKRDVWVNIYRHKDEKVAGQLFYTRELADHYVVFPDRIACIKLTIDCEEGEGL